MQRLSYPTETVLSNKIIRNRIVLSVKDSPRTATLHDISAYLRRGRADADSDNEDSDTTMKVR